jgi:hypothetical protein
MLLVGDPRTRPPGKGDGFICVRRECDKWHESWTLVTGDGRLRALCYSVARFRTADNHGWERRDYAVYRFREFRHSMSTAIPATIRWQERGLSG